MPDEAHSQTDFSDDIAQRRAERQGKNAPNIADIIAQVMAQLEPKIRNLIDQAVDQRIARMVLQSGHGITVTGGNGNWTISFDSSAISWIGSGTLNCDVDPPVVNVTLSGG